MDQHSLQTASVYLNNLLLARGLLRNGKSIDFARPDKSSGGTEATMAKVINLVHDLILRRDREAEQRESLAATLRTLRSNEAQHASEVERITSTCDDLRRNVSAAEAQERALRATAQKAEASARDMKEQMQRMKSTLDQVRSKCQNDIRKRDIELEKLKNHLVNLQRGKRDGTGMNLISVAPHLRERKATADTSSPDYSLEQESNTFLASFVKSLNADLESLNGEHKWLLYLIRRTKQELERIFSADGDEISELGFGSSEHKILPPTCPPTQTYEDLAIEMNHILEHCGAILNNPSYVSIEEVEIRENEIVKLREGWEKMGGRLKEALSMMDTWRRRMIDGGETVKLEELGKGMDLGKSIAVTSHLSQSDSGVDTSAQSLSLVEEQDELDESEKLFGPSVDRVLTTAGPEGLGTQTIDEDPFITTTATTETTKVPETTASRPDRRHHITASPARRFPFPASKHQPPQPHHQQQQQQSSTAPLLETTPNIPRPRPSPRKVSFFPAEPDLPPPSTEAGETEDDDDEMDFDDLLAQEAARAATKAGSNRSNTTMCTKPPSSSEKRLTIAEKLALAQAEADAETAAAEARSKAQQQQQHHKDMAGRSGDGAGDGTNKKRKRDPAGPETSRAGTAGTRTRTRTKRERERERGRRRSTLAPDELEVLMGVR